MLGLLKLLLLYSIKNETNLHAFNIIKYKFVVIPTFVSQTNDALVASLLRLPENKVHIEEAERSLKKKEKYSELIILYEKKGLHEKGEPV